MSSNLETADRNGGVCSFYYSLLKYFLCYDDDDFGGDDFYTMLLRAEAVGTTADNGFNINQLFSNNTVRQSRKR